jgi:hypothetical protein
VLSPRSDRPGVPTPQSRKLGLKSGSAVELVDAPEDFALVDLPPGCTVERLSSAQMRRRRPAATAEVTLGFVRDRADLEALADAISLRGGVASLWLCWPRRAGGHESDLTDELVRAAGLSLGLVDTKVAAINEHWSGLRFSPRRS